MNRLIMFSPVGGTDPISQSNYKDGSMLHICRFLKPDKVFLYLSKEVLEYERSDRRYTWCLEKLMELQGRTFEIEKIERPELVDVQDYDFFYPEFSGIITRIMQEEMDETDTLILNIASGTPAMKSALAVIQTISEVPCRLIQVTTPTKGMNKHDHTGYDVEFLWECNEDNREGAENRCLDVTLPALALMKKEEIIKKHIRAYDYRAAMQIASSMPAQSTKNYIDLLRMMEARLGYDLRTVGTLESKTGLRCLPVRRSDACRRFEYALILQVKLIKKEYADFIRAISPLIADLFEQILKAQCGITIDDYCFKDRRQAGEPRKWDRNKLAGTDILAKLDAAYTDARNPSGFKYGDIKSDNLMILIREFSEDSHLIRLVEDLRDVEYKVRNIAAHNMVSIDEDGIWRMSGQTPGQIMKNIRELFHYTGYNIRSEAWDSYEEMNEEIIGLF